MPVALPCALVFLSEACALQTQSPDLPYLHVVLLTFRDYILRGCMGAVDIHQNLPTIEKNTAAYPR